MNFDYIHAAKVVADFLQADDSAYEAFPDAAFDTGKSIITALQAAGFKITHAGVSETPSATPPGRE